MSYELIGAYPFDDDDDFDDAVAGEEYDDDDDDYGALAGDVEIIGYEDDDDYDVMAGFTDDELDAIAGFEEDLDVLAGYDDDSEVAQLLEATAGLTPRRRRRPARRVRRRPAPARRVAARRVARTVNTLGRKLRQQRARTARAISALRRTRAATRVRTTAPPRPSAARVIPAAGGGQRALVQRQPSSSGVEPIGINSESVIPAGQTRQITVRPQVLFRPTKYHVSESIGQNFLVNNVTIGKHSQFGTSGALPGTTFSDENLRFAWRTCQPGQDITVTVTNITSADHPFLSTMWGDSVE